MGFLIVTHDRLLQIRTRTYLPSSYDAFLTQTEKLVILSVPVVAMPVTVADHVGRVRCLLNNLTRCVKGLPMSNKMRRKNFYVLCCLRLDIRPPSI
jgi:hypothetical protein